MLFTGAVTVLREALILGAWRVERPMTLVTSLSLIASEVSALPRRPSSPPQAESDTNIDAMATGVPRYSFCGIADTRNLHVGHIIHTPAE